MVCYRNLIDSRQFKHTVNIMKLCQSGRFHIVVLVVFLSAFLVFAVRYARLQREIAKSARIRGQLSQILHAINNYAARHGELPPAWISDGLGHRMHSWRILVSLSDHDMRNNINVSYSTSKGWEHDANRDISKLENPSWCSPDMPRDEAFWTSFVAIVEESHNAAGNQHAFQCIVAIPNSGIGWTEPRDIEFSRFMGMIEQVDSRLHGAWAILLDGRMFRILPNSNYLSIELVATADLPLSNVLSDLISGDSKRIKQFERGEAK